MRREAATERLLLAPVRKRVNPARLASATPRPPGTKETAPRIAEEAKMKEACKRSEGVPGRPSPAKTR